MSKANIKRAQEMLIASGFPLPRFGADGDFGNETLSAFLAAMEDLSSLRGHMVPDIGDSAPKPSLPFLSKAGFQKWAPKAVPNSYQAIEAAIAKNSALQNANVLSNWLGQNWVESNGFSTLTENLNYSVDGLLKTFGRHRISEADAKRYGRATGRAANQEAIANIIYGGEWGRKNLGNTQPGDGWRFRGSGVKQITGRYNTEKSGYTPEELRGDIFKSVLASADFFIRAGCVDPASRNDYRGVTLKVNGGTNGLDDRIAKTKSAVSIINRR